MVLPADELVKGLQGMPFLVGIQWGSNSHGWVAFPVAFTSFRRIITNHQGSGFQPTKAVESDTLTGYTLDVGENKTAGYDAQWFAVGK